MHRHAVAAIVVLAACLGGCGESTASSLPVAGVAQMTGPYLAEPYEAFDRALLHSVEGPCAQSVGGAGFDLVLADGRGGGRLVLIYSGPNGTSAECFATIDDGGDVEVESTGETSGGGVVLPGEHDVRPMSGGSSGDPGAWSYIQGRVGPGISRVAIELADGTWITASTGGGHFAAWWPGEAWMSRVHGFDATGNEVANERY